MSLEHLTVPEGKDVLKNKRIVTCQRDTGANLKKLPITKAATM